MPQRAREALDIVSSSIETRAGVAANLGKTRVYYRAGGPAPPAIDALGAGAWRGDADETERGFACSARKLAFGDGSICQRYLAPSQSPNRAREIVNKVCFVASACFAAEAC